MLVGRRHICLIVSLTILQQINIYCNTQYILFQKNVYTLQGLNVTALPTWASDTGVIQNTLFTGLQLLNDLFN